MKAGSSFHLLSFITLAAFFAFNLSGCAQMQRSNASKYGEDPVYNEAVPRRAIHDRATRQTAYELGKDPNSLGPRDLDDIRDRQKVRDFERTLASKKEREQYSKVLPWLKNDQEKIAFLSIPSMEGRQNWINKNKLWDRTIAPKAEMKELIETQDVAMGMPQEYVRRSWGEPISVEVSGNPLYKNERWKFQRQVSTPQGFRKEIRYVYFEGGRVVGWETE